MSLLQYRLLVSCTFLCFALSLVVIGLSFYNQRLEAASTVKQVEISRFQEEINRAGISQRLVENIIRDLATLAPKNAEIQKFLAHYGISLTSPPPPQPSAQP
jgi:hypothetical protein